MSGQIDPSAVVGHGGVLLALVSAGAGAAITLAGLGSRRPEWVRHARVYAGLALAGALVASATLIHAFVVHDFALAYVAANNSRHTPVLYDVSGMWSALQGSILLWGLVLAAYVAALARRLRHLGDEARAGWALVVAYGVMAFFFGLMAGPSDPFVAVAGAVPTDGAGPSPLLQDNLLVAFHPPLLYLGLVGFTVPFALAVAELVTGRSDAAWLAEARRWTLMSWALLSVGVVLGMVWSYQVLGWAGYWAWDPVENGPALVWLVATAYLHSVLAQQRRGLFKVWNLSLILAAFSATIFTTFLTRSDVIESVHSFSQSGLGPLLLGFLAVVALGGIALIGWRADDLRGSGWVDAPVSRQGAFLVNNALFAGFAFMVLVGTAFPLLAQALDGQRLSVGAPYFDKMAAPLGLALVALMAVGPALPWRRARLTTLWSRLRWPAWAGAATMAGALGAGLRGLVPLATFGLGAFAAASALRQIGLAGKRRGWRGLASQESGGMIVHLGVVVFAVSVAATATYSHRGSLTLTPGQTGVFAGQRVAYYGTSLVHYPDHTALLAFIGVNGSPARYHPALSDFSNAVESVGTPAVISGLWRSVYFTLEQSPARAGGPATIGVVVQPLLVWLWIGGALVGLGAVLALVAPDRSSQRPAHASAARSGRSAPELDPAASTVAAGPASVPAGAKR